MVDFEHLRRNIDCQREFAAVVGLTGRVQDWLGRALDKDRRPHRNFPMHMYVTGDRRKLKNGTWPGMGCAVVSYQSRPTCKRRTFQGPCTLPPCWFAGRRSACTIRTPSDPGTLGRGPQPAEHTNIAERGGMMVMGKTSNRLE